MNFTNRWASFLTGGLRPKGLCDCALLSWNKDMLECAGLTDLPACVHEIYDTCKHSSPLVQHYLTIAEYSNVNSSLPILFPSTIETITGTHARRTPLPDATIDSVQFDLL